MFWGLFFVMTWGLSLGGDLMSCMRWLVVLLLLLLLYMAMCGCVLLSFLFNLWLGDLFV